jgi:hypothetical protein
MACRAACVSAELGISIDTADEKQCALADSHFGCSDFIAAAPLFAGGSMWRQLRHARHARHADGLGSAARE